jgi:hypothetical protein
MIVSVAYMDSPVGWMRLQGISGALLRIDFVDEKLNDEMEADNLIASTLRE